MKQNFFIRMFVSLILMHSQSAPAAPVYPNSETNKPQGGESPPSQNTNSLIPVDVTNPDGDQSLKSSYFYPFDSEVSGYVGLTFVSASDGSLPAYGGAGISYLWQSSTRLHLETGAETTALGDGHIWGAGRWILHFTDLFRPYYSFGLGLKLRSDRALANVVDLSNYYFRVACGAEYSLDRHVSVKTEVFGGYDTLGRSLVGVTLGFAYGF
jgi:hypothetical protein